MAGSSISFSCLSPKKKAIEPSVNVVQRLRMRQLRGHLRPLSHSYPVCRSLFGKIPTRLGVPLKQIVDANALHEEGHVFLGFAKDGQFVLSYTLNVHADDHTAYPVYVYKLFWWRFRDNQPMQKVSEVRLFGEEEDIQQDLYLALCSWPTDRSKVLVYGCCTNSQADQEEEKLLCYVTITGVPSISPCQRCIHQKYSADTNGIGGLWTPPELSMEDLNITEPAPPNCLHHCFAVHTKYELAPPFPSFSPKHSLAKDGVVVLNTGDSVIAMAVNMGEKSVCPSLYSPLNSMPPSSGSNHQCSGDCGNNSLSQSPAMNVSIGNIRTCAGSLSQSPARTVSSSTTRTCGSSILSQSPARIASCSNTRACSSSLSQSPARTMSSSTTRTCAIQCDSQTIDQCMGLLDSSKSMASAFKGVEHKHSLLSDTGNVLLTASDPSEAESIHKSSQVSASRSSCPPHHGDASDRMDGEAASDSSSSTSKSIRKKLRQPRCDHVGASHQEHFASSGQDFLSICDSQNESSSTCSSRDETIKVDTFQDWPFSQDSQERGSSSKVGAARCEGTGPCEKVVERRDIADQLAATGRGKAYVASMPEITFPLCSKRSDQVLSSMQGDSCDGVNRTEQSLSIIDAYDEVTGPSNRRRNKTGNNRQVELNNDDHKEQHPDNAQSAITRQSEPCRTCTTKSVGTSPMRCDSGRVMPASLSDCNTQCGGESKSISNGMMCDDGRIGIKNNSQQGSLCDQDRTKDTTINWFLDDSNIGSEICNSGPHCPYHHDASLDDYSAPSSVCTTIQECTCKLQGFAYSIRRYMERMPFEDFDQPIETDSHNYDSMLPVVVCGTQTHNPMYIVDKTSITEGPFIEVKQLTLDAEHYICDTIRTLAPWGRRYIAFTDYDMQILEVCPNSSSVIIMIMALIRAWPEHKETPATTADVFNFDEETTTTPKANLTPKLYQTGFKFAWNLKTGKQKTFEVNDLVEFDQSHLRKTWNPGKELCQKLQRKWSIPQSHARGVHVLTNEAVFKNKSLNRLLDPEHYVAIVLT